MKAATIRDVAERADVSVASVSRVLNGAGPVTEATKNRVLEAAKALQYVPHSGARSLSTSKTQTIGVILPDLYGEFFSELIRGMDVAARSLGYHLIVSSSHDHAGEASAAIPPLRGRVDGPIVLSPPSEPGNLARGLAGPTPPPLGNRGRTAAAYLRSLLTPAIPTGENWLYELGFYGADRVREFPRRNRGVSVEQQIRELNSFLTGWVTYFRHAKARSVLADLGGWVRRKLRCVRLKQRKRAQSITDFLHGLGVPWNRCWTTAASGKGWWPMAHTPAAQQGMNNAWFQSPGPVEPPENLVPLQT